MVKAQKVMWVQRLLANQCSKWKTTAFKVSNMDLFQITCKTSCSYSNKIQSPFYAQVIKFWFEFYSVKPDLKYCDQETLWNNCRILINNEPINCNSVYKNWMERGISRLCHLRNTEGIVLSKGALEQKYDFKLIKWLTIA